MTCSASRGWRVAGLVTGESRMRNRRGAGVMGVVLLAFAPEASAQTASAPGACWS
jgi:hypothetical protein